MLTLPFRKEVLLQDDESVVSKLQRQSRRRERIPLTAALIVAILVICAVFADFLVPHSPTSGELALRFRPPFWLPGGTTDYLLGTDALGRDILSRIILGSRVSLTLAIVTIFLSATIGSAIGLVSGYFGGALDSLLMRFTDAVLSLPLILIAIVLAVVVGPSYLNVILVLGLLLWPGFARQIRSETLSLKTQEFVSLAKVAGCSELRIIATHILPNVMPTLLVLTTYQVGHVILLESSLSFLGVGVPPPTPAWGEMVSEGSNYLRTSWWISLFPGLAILLTVMSINLLGDWIRDRLDPNLRQV
jgi:peptide/nickel transport system permease protein